MQGLAPVALAAILAAFIPTLGVLWVMRAWSLKAGEALWANVRMLVQLLAVGYVLTFIFDAEQPWIVGVVIVFMMLVAAWIALRPLETWRARSYLIALAAIGGVGLLVLLLVTQLVLDLPRWFEPRFLIPLGGMIFANAMNTVSLAAERFDAELGEGRDHLQSRSAAMDAALIPQVNSLLAVGLVSLPGMMTGQILSGVDPLLAVRYQVVVMCMIFGASGLAAAGYLWANTREM